MADVNFDDFTGGPRARPAVRSAGRGRKFTNLVGAAVSLGLMAGAGLWGYQIAERKMNGIPVLKAEPGPMRVAPDNPGGEVTEHQGLSVNDVAAIGVATPLPDEIVLAPHAVELTADDVPGLAPAAPAALVSPQADAPPVQPLTVDRAAADPAVGTIAPAVPVAVQTADSAAQALAATIAEGAAALSDPAASDPALASALNEALAGTSLVTGGLGSSMLPKRRPAEIAAMAPKVQAQPAPIAAEALSAGARVVQFGVFESVEAAEAKWSSLVSGFGELMAGKSRVVQSAESAGRTFYRLRAAGFADEADARRFCSALSSEGTECIPVELR